MSEAFIRIEGLQKTFQSRGKNFAVLKGINLEIEKGDVFGIVGFSGAGKTTLIRCINRLETPDSGTITLGGREVTGLSLRELEKYRQKIGIIFQQFNLLDSRTVFGNVSFPLEVAGEKRDTIKKRVMEILDLVGLSGKWDFYPGQLSGGQKQRVGIARALANHPDILLSDEATSALDPLTSLSILDLLMDINKKLGLTIVLITHELDLIRYACSRVAVLEEGLIVEAGSVKSIFSNPKSETAKLFMKINRDFSNHDWQDGSGI
ncbi:MAG: ATP-binding cassette domain-containing protein [Spirochaetaceae bacterium]|jgi:D-methionine transport system ATP-binding protein|nr:ATP-binding cassette domain-containing protein [Spirochaetaceae bacterium]